LACSSEESTGPKKEKPMFISGEKQPKVYEVNVYMKLQTTQVQRWFMCQQTGNVLRDGPNN